MGNILDTGEERKGKLDQKEPWQADIERCIIIHNGKYQGRLRFVTLADLS